jgi:hypothetical protein
VPPEPDEGRHGTEGLFAVSESDCRATCGGSEERAAVLVPGVGPVPLRRFRGSTGLLEGLPGQRINQSAYSAA